MTENANEDTTSEEGFDFPDDEIKVVLNTMADNFRESDEKNFGSLYYEYFPHAKQGVEYIPAPREFEHRFVEDKRIMTTMARMISDQLGIPKDRSWRAVYVYTNYSFIKSFVSALIAKFEGGSCSVDKTGWLVREYVKAQKTDGAIDTDVFEEQPWNAPLLRFVPLWTEILDELPYFQNGNYYNLYGALNRLEAYYSRDESA